MQRIDIDLNSVTSFAWSTFGTIFHAHAKFLLLLIIGHVHKYQAVLWTLEKLRKTIFYYKMINFSPRESKFSGSKYFSFTERLASARVEKVLWLQRNDEKVTFLLIYHLSGF